MACSSISWFFCVSDLVFSHPFAEFQPASGDANKKRVPE